MVLINCPVCKKEISDEAVFCPHCGLTLSENSVAQSEKTKKYCVDCNAELSDEFSFCPNCGCPAKENDYNFSGTRLQQNELTKNNISLFKKKSFWSILICCILVIFGVVFGIKTYKNNQERMYAEKYFSNMRLANSTMLSGAASSETVCNLIQNVWNNAIYGKKDTATSKYTAGASDFNEALANLFKDEDFIKQIEEIKNNQVSVSEYMKSLNNPPEQYKNIYDDLREYYDAYLEFTNLAINPTGSLSTFSSKFNEIDSKTLKCYQQIEISLGN